MNGEDMVNAMGYIDEAYIAEAESAKFSAKAHWVKAVGAAACLCLLVGTLYALRSERMPAESMDGKTEISAGGILQITEEDAVPRGTVAYSDTSKVSVEPKSYLFSTQAIRTDGGREDISYPFVTVLRSREELEDYCMAQGALFDLSTGFLDSCDAYDAQYFSENDLILLCLEESGNSLTQHVTDFRWEDGSWVITVAKDGHQDSGDVTQWHILIHVQMGKVIAPESKVTVRIENKEN